jgi:tRNA(Ile)-lysidine synthase
MRIIKGTALKGIVGIPPVRYQRKVKIARPLIELTRTQIEDYLKKNLIPYRMDHTNLKDVYFRNKVRNRVLPYLAGYNPRIKYALANLAETLREDFDFIEEEKKKSSLTFSSKGKTLSLKLKDIILQPRALRKEIARDALAASGANIKKLSYKHWKDIDNFIRVKQNGKSLDLPGGIRLKKKQDELVFFKPKPRN